ncbi:hypothetical protein [Chryseobacterium viscerum]|uniref:Uncharacterized protein n=1 Tax=Chryseobacterium viscerum TaxID=1037377 RepID=A0A316WER9_9FLAO|nr:hypothetical protein [Chryseobacterium viscerum]PWN59944.1 hypothetical protein C1634_017650 [Chryseobacterium viscerum]
MKKIYYFPGLISAVIIPVLFWYYGNKKFEDINVSVMDIGLPTKEIEGIKSTFESFETYRDWDYKKIKIDPSTAKENSKLYVSELKKLQKRNEKESGIEFILDQNNTYGDFVSVLNDLAIAQQEQYAVDLEKTGHIFAVYSYIDPNPKPLEYECLLCNDTVYRGPEEIVDTFQSTQYGKIFNLFTTASKKASYIIFGFLIFLNISMLSIKERFQIHH